MTNNHQHARFTNKFTVEQSKRLADITGDIERMIDAHASEIAMAIVEDSVDIPDWLDCDDCDEYVHEKHDDAYHAVIKAILKTVKSNLMMGD